jgi:peptide/nickel transport system substrate-binding protein
MFFDLPAQFHGGQGQWIPLLFKEWEFIDDGPGPAIDFTFKESKWAPSGDPIRAKDWYGQLLIKRAMNGADTAQWQFIDGKDSLEIRDEKTLRVGLTDPISPEVFSMLAFAKEGVLQTKYEKYEGVIETIESATTEDELESVIQTIGDKQIDEPFASGPWQPVEQTSSRILAEPNEGHWAADKVDIPNLEILPSNGAARPEAQHQMGIDGQLDGIYKVAAATESVTQAMPDHAQFPLVPKYNGFGLNINNTVEPFDDWRVRQAIAYSFGLNNTGEVALPGKPVESGSCGMSNYYYDEWIDEEFLGKLNNYMEPDHEKAAARLEEAGFTKEDGQWLDTNGEPFSFTILTIGSRVPWGQRIADGMNSLGADVDVKSIEPSTLFGQRVPEGQFEVALWVAIGWLQPHPFGDYDSVFRSSAVAETVPTEQEVPWPPGDPDGTKTVDVSPWIDKLAQPLDEEEETEVIQNLAWVYNQAVPQIRLDESHLVSMQTTDAWNVPAADSSEQKIFHPLIYLQESGQLTAKTE